MIPLTASVRNDNDRTNPAIATADCGLRTADSLMR
jgi:hypothetical protein